MKGLIRKDFYVFSKSLRSMILIVGVFLIYSFLSPENIFFSIFPAVLLSSCAMTVLSYDERCGWQSLAGALPVKKQTQVYAKYLFVLMMLGRYLVFFSVIGLVVGAFRGEMNFTMLFSNLLLSLAAGLGGPIVLYPVMFRLGVEKGRVVYYIVIVAVSMLAGGMASILEENSANAALSTALPAASENGMMLAVIGAELVLYALSAVLAAQLYAKREL